MQNSMRGAGKGGGSSFTQKPDNLRSNDTFEGLIGLCVGPIKGPVRGLKSIRVNGTPVEGDDGTLNFPDFSALVADGDPLKFPQIADLKLGAAGSPDQVGANIRNDKTAGGNPWVTHTLNNQGADAIDMRFVVQQLFHQTAKGIYEDTLNLEIQMKPVGTATWINPFAANGTTIPPYSETGYDTGSVGGFLRLMISEFAYNENVARVTGSSTSGNVNGQYLTIRGKTTSPYVHELRVLVPNTGPYANKAWDIRVRLLERESFDSPEGTKEADKITERRMVNWESLTAVYHSKLGAHEDWRGLAWLQLYGKASDNFTGLPEVDGIYDTKIVSVPNAAVYNPVTRLYSGTIWDGSWSKAYCNDPAWVINDAISDSLSGIAAFVPGAGLNKWDALELSKWASQPVPDGLGGTHPRYSMNLIVDQPQKADEFIRYLAGAVGATAWDNGDGEWRLKVDKPEAPSNVFTHENIEGEFLYSHTDVDTRFNDVTVVFINEEFDFREDRVRVQDFADIEKNGRKPTQVVAIGCTNRQQALRLAVLRLRTNINEKRMVTFSTNRQGKHLERFDQILIADGSLNKQLGTDNRRSTGRLIARAADSLSVTVRDPLRLEIGASYKLHFTVPNPAYNPEPTAEPTDSTWDQPTVTVTRNITNTAAQRGDVTQLVLNAALPADVPENAVVALEAVGLPALPKVYRVVDVGYNDDGERVTVNAVEIDTGKWAAADNASETRLEFEKPVYLIPVPKAPADGAMFHVDTYVTDRGLNRVLTVRWERPVGRYTTTYNVRYRVNQGPWRLLDETGDTSIEIQQPDAGSYDFEVTANDRRGRVSQPLKGSYVLDDLLVVPPAAGLTNEAALLYADWQGTVTDYHEAVGRFFLNNSTGIITEGVSYYVKPGSATGGLAVTLDQFGNYAATGLTADQGSVSLIAEWGDFKIEKVFSVSKSRAGQPGNDGQPGAAAKGFFLQSNTQTVPTTSAGAPVDGTQIITFIATRQNTLQTPSWSLTKIDGTAVAGGITLTVAGDGLSATLTHAKFNTARGSLEGLIIKATCDGLSDQISVVRVQAGTSAPNLLSQYSVDGATSWHANFTNGDLYVRTSNDNGTSYSPAIKIVGANGTPGQNTGVIMLYKRSATAPAQNPTGTFTYTFATGTLAADAGSSFQGWSQTYPATDGNPLYALQAGVASANASVSFAPAWFSTGKILQDGAPGANAKLVYLTYDIQQFTYDGTGALSPATQVSKITMIRQNTAAGQNPSWSATAYNSAGASLGVVQLRTTAAGTVASTTEAVVYLQSAALPAGTFYVIVTGTCDGLSDTAQITRAKDGATGQPGAAAKTLYVSSDIQQVKYDGTDALVAGQTVTFKANPQNLSSASYTISLATLSGTVLNANTYLAAGAGGALTASGNNAVLTGAATFTISGTNFNTARGATNGIVATVAHVDGVSDQISVTKYKDGATGQPGATAKSLKLLPTQTQVRLDKNGAVAAGQSLVFTAQGSNLAGDPTFSRLWHFGNGNTFQDTYSPAAGGRSWDPGVDANGWGTSGLAATSMDVWVDWDGLRDTIKITPVADGATGQTGQTGATGPTLDISAPIGVFVFVDGVLTPSPQTITVSALVNGVATPISWVVRKADGSAIRTPAGTAATLAVTDTDLGANESIVVEGSYNGVVARIPLGRGYKSSQATLDTISYTRSNALDVNGALLNAAANGVLTVSEKKTRVEPEIASIQSTYARYRAQAVAQGVSVVALDTAYNNLGAATGATTGYLAPFNASTNPNGTSIRVLSYATSIDLPTFTSYFKSYYDAEAALAAALSGAAATTATWGSVTGTGRPADGATSDINLTSIGSQVPDKSGNSFLKPAGAANGHQCCVRSDPLIGSAYTEVDIIPGSFYTVACLDDDATTIPDGVSMNLQVSYMASSGAIDIFRNSASIISTSIAANITGKLVVLYDGVRYRVWLGGTEYALNNAGMLETAGRKLWAKWSAYTSGSPRITGLKAIPYTQNNLDVIGDGSISDWSQTKNGNLRISSAAGVLYATYLDKNGASVSVDTEDLNSAGIDATRLVNGPIEAGSDKTSNQQIVVQAPSAITINCDSNGTPINSPLSQTSNLPTVTKGGTSVRTTSSFSATFNNCSGTYNNTANDPNRGQVTITGATSNTAWVDIVVTVGTVVMPFVRLYVYKSLAAAAAASPASGGTGTGPAQDSRALANINTTTPTVMAGPFTIRAGAGGKITLQVASDYDIIGMTTGGVSLNGKLQINLGSGMTDITTDTSGATVAATVTGTQATCFNNNMPGEPGMVDRSPGNISFTRQARGLTPGNDYQVQFVGWGTNTRTIAPYGDVTGTAA